MPKSLPERRRPCRFRGVRRRLFDDMEMLASPITENTSTATGIFRRGYAAGTSVLSGSCLQRHDMTIPFTAFAVHFGKRPSE